MQKIDNLLGENNEFLSVLEQTSRLAKINKPVLILGERGTGKELIAQRLHFLSSRWDSPLVTLNCAALNEQLLDSELFGHEAGAFTGAQKKHKGRFERADKGTLFLDEIANAPQIVQEKLLRVIEYGELERVGGNQELKVDVRLVCATNEDLALAAAKGTFRADLLDRLAFDVINIPPLRERGNDILLLAQHFAVSVCRELGWAYFPGFSDEAIAQLYQYHWPGNVRELKNVIERSIFRTDENSHPIKQLFINPFTRSTLNTNAPNKNDNYFHKKELSSPHLRNESNDLLSIHNPGNIDISSLPQYSMFPINFKEQTEEFQIMLIKNALSHSSHNQKKAAQLLGLTYDKLRALIKKYKTKLNSSIRTI